MRARASVESRARFSSFQVLLKALKECDYNRTAAANRLGLNLRQIRYRIQRLGITMPSDDDDSTT